MLFFFWYFYLSRLKRVLRTCLKEAPCNLVIVRWDECRWIFTLFGPKTTPANNKPLIISSFSWLHFNASYLCAYFTCALVEHERKRLAVLRWVWHQRRKLEDSFYSRFFPKIQSHFRRARCGQQVNFQANNALSYYEKQSHRSQKTTTQRRKRAMPQPGRQQSIQNKNSPRIHLMHPLWP